MTDRWRDLFTQTLRNPGAAAETILAADPGKATLYSGLFAGAALNALLTSVSVMVYPLPEAWPNFTSSPLAYFVVVAGSLLVFAHLLTWAGRMLGGHGGIDAILALLVWLQFVRVVLQALGLLLSVAVPLLGGLYGILVTALSLYILLHFIRVGHEMPSLGRAALVLIVTFIGLISGLSILLALAGVGPMGGLSNV
jgi:hypothetical protein